jgi:hypothetical protein
MRVELCTQQKGMQRSFVGLLQTFGFKERTEYKNTIVKYNEKYHTLQANSGTDPRLVLLIDHLFIILTFDAIRAVIAQSDGYGSDGWGSMPGRFFYLLRSVQ